MIATQRWLKLRAKSGASGWTPETFVLTKLMLSTHARTLITAALRTEMNNSSRVALHLPAGTKVRILAHKGNWLYVQSLIQKTAGFVTSEVLEPALDSPALGYIKARTFLHEQAHIRSESLMTLEPGARVEILQARPNTLWALVRSHTRTGHIERGKLVLREDIPLNSVLAIRHGIALRRGSAATDAISYQARWLEPLTFLESCLETWGRVRLRREGERWWQMTAKENGGKAAKPLRLSTDQLFRRKIFDIASSPIKHGLKFASASGIFRTMDGKTWTRIDTFKEQNHPIAISNSGTVFIGPYMSLDHGVTFQEYIRWDNLVAKIRNHWRSSAHSLRIIEIKPSDTDGRRIRLRLDIGLKQDVKVSSDDQGQSWRTF